MTSGPAAAVPPAPDPRTSRFGPAPRPGGRGRELLGRRGWGVCAYRMGQIWAEFLASLAGAGRPLPLFRVPVLADPVVARSLRRLHSALTGPDSELERYDRLTATARLLVRHASRRVPVAEAPPPGADPGPAAR